jgi:formylmethanofuran--tetrahydromethanopterin N-formyltransferase
MMKVEIEDTYAEAFDGLYIRIVVTAKDKKRLKKAVFNSTALPSVVLNRTEGGIERWLSTEETPDGRLGAILQYWGSINDKAQTKSVDRLYREVSYRIRQGILVVPTTAIYNACISEEKIDTLNRIGHCGDGYEFETIQFGRQIIKIPIMMGEFIIERYLGYRKGVMGGNVWLMCTTEDVALKAGDKAVNAIKKVEGVITPFDICAAGSKPETKFPHIGPTTNHPYCPTIRQKISDSKISEGINAIPEIVINGISLQSVKKAMKEAILSVQDIQGVVKISAGNYSGELGKYKIYLKELFQ